MKKVSCALLLVSIILLSVCCSACMAGNVNEPIEEENGGNLYKIQANRVVNFNLVDKSDFYSVSKEIAVKGNYTNVDMCEVKQMLGVSRVVVLYDMDLKDNVDEKSVTTSSNASVFYYNGKVIVSHTFKSATTNRKQLKQEIDDFVNSKLATVNVYSTTDTQSTDSQYFQVLYSGSHRDTHKAYGDVCYEFEVLKYRANDVSSLYLVEVQTYFIPGVISNNTDTIGLKKYNLKAGYIHIGASRSAHKLDDSKTIYGGKPVLKDVYPAIPNLTVITSSYSDQTILGYSFSNGFSVDEKSIVRAFDKAYTATEPRLSTQYNAENREMFEWYFAYSESKAESNHLRTGYLFEMNNSGHDLSEGDLALNIDYSISVKYPYWFTRSFAGSMYYNWH